MKVIMKCNSYENKFVAISFEYFRIKIFCYLKSENIVSIKNVSFV